MARPKITDMAKVRLSPSSINSFHYCQKKWYKTYVERIEQTDSIHTIRGKAVHKACEDIFDKEFMNTLPYETHEAVPIIHNKIQELFKANWETYRETITAIELNEEITKPALKDFNSVYTQSMHALKMFADRMIGEAQILMDKGKVKRFRTAFKRVAPKFRELWLDDKTLNVGGFIDAVQSDPYSDDIALIDYKTSLRKDEMLTIDYRRQLAIYAYLYDKEKKVRPRYVGIHYLLDNNTVLLEVTDELIQFAKDTIQEVREKIVAWGFDESKYSDICRFKRTDGKWIEYKWKGDM